MELFVHSLEHSYRCFCGCSGCSAEHAFSGTSSLLLQKVQLTGAHRAYNPTKLIFHPAFLSSAYSYIFFLNLLFRESSVILWWELPWGLAWRGALVQPTCSCLCLVASDPGLRTQGSYLQHQCNLALATAFEFWIKFLLLPQVFLVNPAQWLPDLLSPQPSIALTILPAYLAINHIVLFSIVYCLIL